MFYNNEQKGVKLKEFSNEKIDEIILKHFPGGKVPRKEQMETFRRIIKSFLKGDKHFIGQLPTGVGKSYIAVAITKILEEFLDARSDIEKDNYQGVILAKTKALQDQYINEFPLLVDIKGKTNYVCSFGTTYSTDNCLKMVKSKRCKKENCPYLVQRKKWLDEFERITNMSFFISYPEAKSSIVVIDECHTLADELINYGTIVLDENEMNAIKDDSFNNNYLKVEEIFLELNKFIKSMVGIIISREKINSSNIKNLIELLESEVQSFKENDLLDVPFYYNLSLFFGTLANKLALMLYSKGDYIFQLEKRGDEFMGQSFHIQIKPIYAHQVSDVIFDKGSYFIHLSATIGDIEVYAEENGIKSYDSYECSSPFPVENRKIVFKPVVDFSYKNQEEAIEKTSKIIDKIIEKHKGEMGIIHTSSYYFANIFKEKSKFENDIVVAKDSYTINKYKGKKILIGPTLFEGHDFKDNFAKWQILTKIPYASLGDSYVKTKMQMCPKWYQQETANRIIQSYGRAVRHKDDEAIFYIFDKNFNNFKRSNYLPIYVKEAIIELKGS